MKNWNFVSHCPLRGGYRLNWSRLGVYNRLWLWLFSRTVIATEVPSYSHLNYRNRNRFSY
jgi:hypothetical protein